MLSSILLVLLVEFLNTDNLFLSTYPYLALIRANSRDDKTADDDLTADGINTRVTWGWRPTQYRATALFTKHAYDIT